MASYYLNLKTFGRSNGSSAPGAAAYRAGERIRDERTGRTYDHTERQDVLHKEILVPSDFAGHELSWARDRANLWNAAEAAESRRNARTAREYLVALPVELDPEGRVGLARNFAQELADRYRFAVDVAVHAPRDFPGSDPRNFHAHLLATTREVNRDGLGAKTTLELNESSRKALGLGPSIGELLHVRERWATVTNDALREANVDARSRSSHAPGTGNRPRTSVVDPQSRLRGRAPGLLQPGGGAGSRRIPGERGGAPAGASSPGAKSKTPRPVARQRAPPAREPTVAPPSLADMQRQARENWLRVRKELAEARPEAARSQGRDDDLSR